jgi:hypothetical protein
MELAKELAEFYKHCLNVAGEVRPGSTFPILWSGWMRCRVKPYLENGNVKDEVHPRVLEMRGENACEYKNRVIETILDYYAYGECLKIL